MAHPGVEPGKAIPQGHVADGEAKSASLLGGVHTWLLFLATLILYQKTGDLSSFK